MFTGLLAAFVVVVALIESMDGIDFLFFISVIALLPLPVVFYMMIAGIEILVNSQLAFYTDDEGITRSVDLDIGQLHGFHKFYFTWVSRKGPRRSHLIKWADIVKIQFTMHSLCITSKNRIWTGEDYSQDGMRIPEEIEGFDELEKIIRQKTQLK